MGHRTSIVNGGPFGFDVVRGVNQTNDSVAALVAPAAVEGGGWHGDEGRTVRPSVEQHHLEAAIRLPTPHRSTLLTFYELTAAAPLIHFMGERGRARRHAAITLKASLILSNETPNEREGRGEECISFIPLS